MQRDINRPKEDQDVFSGTERIYGAPVRNMIAAALISVLLGIVFLLMPRLFYQYCGMWSGAALALAGFVGLIGYFARATASGEYRYGLCAGIAAVLLGGYIGAGDLILPGSIDPMSFTDSLIVLGLLMAADGLVKLQYSVDLCRMKFRGWWVVLITAVLGMTIGAAAAAGYVYNAGAVVASGLDAFQSGMLMLGTALCLNGFLDIAAMIVIAVRNHRAKKAARSVESDAGVGIHEPAYYDAIIEEPADEEVGPPAQSTETGGTERETAPAAPVTIVEDTSLQQIPNV